MKIASEQIMREIDKYCIEVIGIPGILLMENAALKVVKNLELEKYNYYSVVCGRGNNGGDGFAAARHLTVLGKKVEVFLVGSEDGMSQDCKINYNILKNMGIKINKINNVEDASEFRNYIENCETVIDAIFGTGLSRNVEGIYDLIISIINENGKNIIAVDVPSGFNGNSGRAMGNCIKANKTVTFQLYKKGFLSYGSHKFTGDIVVEDIGIPNSAIEKFHENEFIVDETIIKAKLKVRDRYAHKGDYGKVFIAAGSKGFTGAAYIAAEAAVKSGAGLVTLCCNEDIQSILSSKLTEAMTVGIGEKNRIESIVINSNSIAAGPGMGNNENTLEFIKYILEKAECPVVLDADGINVLKDQLSLFEKAKNRVIITPHLGEMSRITGLPIDYIQENRIQVSKDFAKKHKVIVVLKGYNTIITDGETVLINPTGNSSMASGGMGDCLTGIIASFIGQGYKPMEAAVLSVYIHGCCGDMLAEDMFCVSATSVLNRLPYVIKNLLSISNL